MSLFTSRGLAILALFAVWLNASLCVQADEAAPADAAPAEGASDVAVENAEGEAPAEEPANDEEKGQQFVDSARELQEKLAQLKSLLDAKGEGADPGLKEKLAGLESQLSGLGLDSLTGGGGAGSNPELTEFLSACVAMSLRRAGMQRPATLGALRKLVENKLTPAEASKNELWRMVGVCVGDFREDEFANFKNGKIKILPKSYVDASKKPEAEKKVMEIDAAVWEDLRKISTGLLDELTPKGDGEQPPFNVAYLFMIPMGLGVAFLGKLFMDMKKREEEEQARKAKKKEGKKSN